MEKLSPEDISRARKLATVKFKEWLAVQPLDWKSLDLTEFWIEFAAAYSAAENERLTQELEQERAKTDVELEDRAESTEAKCDRLEGALERIQEFATTEAQSSRDLDAGDAAEWDKVVKMAALRPEGE